jgi:MscS family membrane protein
LKGVLRPVLAPRAARLAAICAFLLIGLGFAGLPSHAQTTPAAAERVPLAGADVYGRDSPRGLSKGLLSALAAQDYDRASVYFDLSTTPTPNRKTTGVADARRLQDVLDAGGSLIQPVQLSDEPSGRIDDQLAPDRERIGTLPGTKGGDPLPLIAASQNQGGKRIWLISRESLAVISAMSASRTASLRDQMPRMLRESAVFGAPIADWLLLIGVALAFYIVVRLLCLGLLLVVSRLTPIRQESWWCRIVTAAPTSISLWVGMLLFIGTTRTLEAAIVAKQVATRWAGAIALLALAWFVWRMVDLGADLIAARMKRSKRLRARSILIFVRRAFKLLILLVAGIQALKILGFDVTTGIAALGIGGIAIALGAQKTVENLVGSVSVVADEPIRVGDVCKVGDVYGTVEEIGIRSTRIRTDARTIVTIPNGNFSSLQIENFSARDRYLVATTFRLSIDLDASTVERILDRIRITLASAGFMCDGARANIAKFGDNWIEVEIFGWINVPDSAAAIPLREQLLLDVMRSVEAEDGRFFGSAVPLPAPDAHAEKDQAEKKAPAKGARAQAARAGRLSPDQAS